MTDQEISRLGKVLCASEDVIDLADRYLKRLNRLTQNSIGKGDMLKYLACFDLAHRYYSIPLNVEIGNKCGLKSNLYPNVIQSITKIVQFKKQVTFDELATIFKCSYFKSRIVETYEKYYSKKLESLPPIQRPYVDLGSPIYRAACFKIAAKVYGKTKIDDTKLCQIMCIDKRKFDLIVQDVNLLCFSQKRKFGQLNDNSNNNNGKNGKNGKNDDNKKENENENENSNDDMFQDGYKSRKERKHQEWRNKQLQFVNDNNKNNASTVTPKMSNFLNNNKGGKVSSRPKRLQCAMGSHNDPRMKNDATWNQERNQDEKKVNDLNATAKNTKENKKKRNKENNHNENKKENQAKNDNDSKKMSSKDEELEEEQDIDVLPQNNVAKENDSKLENKNENENDHSAPQEPKDNICKSSKKKKQVSILTMFSKS